MPNIELACPLTLEDLTDKNFEEAILIIVGTTVYPILPSKDDEGKHQETALNNLKKLDKCPNTRIKGAYKFLVLATLRPEGLKMELKNCLFNEEKKEPNDLATDAEEAPLVPTSTSQLAKWLIDKNKQFPTLLTDKTFSQAQTAPVQQNPTVFVGQFFNGLLSVVEYDHLPWDTQLVIIHHDQRVKNLLENGLSFVNIESMGADRLRGLVAHPDGVTALRQCGATIDQLCNIDTEKLGCLLCHHAGVNVLRQCGATFDQLRVLEIERLRVLVKNHAGVNVLRQCGATFDQLRVLEIERLRVLVQNHAGVNVLRQCGATFDQLRVLEIERLRVLVQNHAGVNVLIQCGATFDQLRVLEIERLRVLVKNHAGVNVLIQCGATFDQLCDINTDSGSISRVIDENQSNDAANGFGTSISEMATNYAFPVMIGVVGVAAAYYSGSMVSSVGAGLFGGASYNATQVAEVAKQVSAMISGM